MQDGPRIYIRQEHTTLWSQHAQTIICRAASNLFIRIQHVLPARGQQNHLETTSLSSRSNWAGRRKVFPHYLQRWQFLVHFITHDSLLPDRTTGVAQSPINEVVFKAMGTLGEPFTQQAVCCCSQELVTRACSCKSLSVPSHTETASHLDQPLSHTG